MRSIIHTLAMSVLLVSIAVGLRAAAALAMLATGARLSEQARDMFWRVLAVKLAAVTITVIAIAGAS